MCLIKFHYMSFLSIIVQIFFVNFLHAGIVCSKLMPDADGSQVSASCGLQCGSILVNQFRIRSRFVLQYKTNMK